MRKTIVTLHRLFGLTLGLIVITVCGTGALLTFEDEITDLLNRELIRVPHSPISADHFYKLAQEQLQPGERVARLELPLGPVRAQGKEGRRKLFFDPNDGTYLGTGNLFMSNVLALHRRLLLSNTGRWFTLTSALGVFLLSLSGLKLWWPQKRELLRKSLTIKTNGSRHRLFFDIHRVGGVIVALPFLLIVLTGLNFSIIGPSYRKAIHSLLNAPPPQKPLLIEAGPGEPTLTLEQAITLAQERFPTAVLTSIDLPKDSTRCLTVRLRHPGQPDSFGRSTVEFDPYTGTLLRATDATLLPLGHRLTTVWALPLHRGRALGRFQQLLWLCIALIGVTLPSTGAWLWWNKRRLKANRKGRPDCDLP